MKRICVWIAYVLAICVGVEVAWCAEGARNLAVGAKASANGHDQTADFGGPFTADKAIDGIEYWYDDQGKPTGAGWAGSLSDSLSRNHPGIWSVEFPEAVDVNRVKIFSPRLDLRLQDFALEYQPVGSRGYRRVEPLDDAWKNPIVDSQPAVCDLPFRTVKTKLLRVVVTRGAPAHNQRPGAKGGIAYISEFEAYYEPDEQRDAMAQKHRHMVGVLSNGAQTWERDRVRPVGKGTPAPQGDLAWLTHEKFRAGFTTVVTHKLIEYADQFREMGLNTLLLVSWHWEARGQTLQDDLLRLNQLAHDKDFYLFGWTAWYWYPKDETFSDRFAMDYLGSDYRGAVDYQGTKLFPTPCPMDDAFWKSMKEQGVAAASMSKQPGTDRLQGFLYDLELYGAPNGRFSDSFNYDKCFCDDCFDTFLATIGADFGSSDVEVQDRYGLLRESGALEAYYALLMDRASVKAREIRQAVDEVNPAFVLGFYGVYPPFGAFERQLDDLPTRRFFASWYGEALFRELGTPEVPMIYVPLITDPASNPFSTMRAQLQAYIHAEELPVLYCPGYLIMPEQQPKYIENGIVEALTDNDGYWMNEMWMFWSYKEDPSKGIPPWFDAGTTMAPIGDYVNAMKQAMKRWQEGER